MRNRSVIEIMVICFTFVVAFGIVATGAFVAIVEFRDPTVDTERTTEALFGLIAYIVGALLGLLAGKSEALQDLDKRPDQTDSGLMDPPEKPRV